MEDWIAALKVTATRELYSKPGLDPHDLLRGKHSWQQASHARPTYCNVCREALSGVTSHGLSCEICKLKVHKRCVLKAINNCKWSTLSSIGKDIIEDKDGNLLMPHQWMEGNLPVSAKCVTSHGLSCEICKLKVHKRCVLKAINNCVTSHGLSCEICKLKVHKRCVLKAINNCVTSHGLSCEICKLKVHKQTCCNLGPCRLSTVPPTSLHSVGGDEAWEGVRPPACSPLLVFVNSKSGDNQGVKFLRRFKQLLNPAQVFDLIGNGPGLGLRLFRHFDPFRILVCSGDGSVGWVLSEIDRLNMQKQCQIGVLPLGTGNDLARVLGWGASCDDDTHLPQLLEKYEKASTKILDRWSIMTFERSISTADGSKITLNTTSSTGVTSPPDPNESLLTYEERVTNHLTKILISDDKEEIIHTANIFAEITKGLMMTGPAQFWDTHIGVLELRRALMFLILVPNVIKIGPGNRELQRNKQISKTKPTHLRPTSQTDSESKIKKDLLLGRANSLKKAVRHLMEHSEKSPEPPFARSPPTHPRGQQLSPGSNGSEFILGPPPSPSNTDTASMKSVKSSLKVESPGLYTDETLLRPSLISPLPDHMRRGSDLSNLAGVALPVPSEFADYSAASHEEHITSSLERSLSGGTLFTYHTPSELSAHYSRATGSQYSRGIDSEGDLHETNHERTKPSPDQHPPLSRQGTLDSDPDTQGGAGPSPKPKPNGLEDGILSGLKMSAETVSEMGHIDSSETSDVSPEGSVLRKPNGLEDGILSGLKMSAETVSEMGHIDSSETSDISPEGSVLRLKMENNRKASLLPIEEMRPYEETSPRRHSEGVHPMSRKVSSDHTTVSYPELDNPDIEFDASNLISTSPEDISDDDFRRELNFLHDGNGNGNGTSQSSSGGRPCSIAHFVEGNDIARRSIKCRHMHLVRHDNEEDEDDDIVTAVLDRDASLPCSSTARPITGKDSVLSIEEKAPESSNESPSIPTVQDPTSVDQLPVIPTIQSAQDLSSEDDASLPCSSTARPIPGKDSVLSIEEKAPESSNESSSIPTVQDPTSVDQLPVIPTIQSAQDLSSEDKEDQILIIPTIQSLQDPTPQDQLPIIPTIQQSLESDREGDSVSQSTVIERDRKPVIQYLDVPSIHIESSNLLDVVNIRIKGSNGTLTAGDSSHLNLTDSFDSADIHELTHSPTTHPRHRSYTLSSEYKQSNGTTEGGDNYLRSPSDYIEGRPIPRPPSVIVDPPSPPLDQREEERGKEEEEGRRRRFSYDSCRRLSAASPSMLLHSPQSGRRISNIGLMYPVSISNISQDPGSSIKPGKTLPIINPLVRLPNWPNVSGSGGLISKVLLANADALCAAAVPLMDPDETLMEGYYERCVMNNYFGIGIDAQISLDFHHKREEHPEKCRSRARNYMWYGVLGSKQWLAKTYKNLEQRVQLECDGQRIPLPSLQGIVVLNIPSVGSFPQYASTFPSVRTSQFSGQLSTILPTPLADEELVILLGFLEVASSLVKLMNPVSISNISQDPGSSIKPGKTLPIINPLVHLPNWPNVSGKTLPIINPLVRLPNWPNVSGKTLPIINPLVRLPNWPNVSGSGGLISKVLLANADALCAAAVPLMDPDETLMEGYYERCVMNNYFGIGIDAQISLDFHHKREEHPEKCRSRARNYMWYGVLGSKQWLAKTYKNLEQRVQLELNMLNTNEKFHILLIVLQVQINILGEEGVPIQVDGEAWVQPPGMIRIIHKNRMQMLCRNRALENSLKSWEEKQQRAQRRNSQCKILPTPLADEELVILLGFLEVASSLVKCVKSLVLRHPSIEQDLYELANTASAHLESVHPGGKLLQGLELRPAVTQMVSSVRKLNEETCTVLRNKSGSILINPDLEAQLSSTLSSMETELNRCYLSHVDKFIHLSYEPLSHSSSSSKLLSPHTDDSRTYQSKYKSSPSAPGGTHLSWLSFRRKSGDSGTKQPSPGIGTSGKRGESPACHWGVAEVQINILGEEGVPIQVDGEAWVQPPGMIRIIHKNRMQMLCRNRALENSLKSWEEKQQRAQRRNSQCKILPTPLADEELVILLGFLELELRPAVTQMVSSVRKLNEETCTILRNKSGSILLNPDLESQLSSTLSSMETELNRCYLSHVDKFIHLSYEPLSHSSSSSKLLSPHTDDSRTYQSKYKSSPSAPGGTHLSWLSFRRKSGDSGTKQPSPGTGTSGKRGESPACHWGVAEVSTWLESISLGEYVETFGRHDIRGSELLTLTRRDLKDLGISKVGHVKRLLSAVKQL
ncbi:LOW QUALITY PROTEIN: diacylglycerol kinase eta-like [Diaphorina citri]|uniref:Diacylglycerol kinase n=2 Tax=Diaphorina citri TaxID=121845 RepID=A0A3Q0J368_DIACI|nr:LOW QUALITY PROTEIN: diacylglycerol kinase eta-like [Diaphorina citri]